ncbi:multidrug ABC transporter ATP-binding protein [Scytonema hofmannii PCC 7110]|uniref:Multidrug ABC transporter ATP-binding protein n=1 Tax=Scytonema hofmannii PCC 7110 TaxID=128403 RepID=A0A139WXG1_9CYAN|nr:ABC transporter ATP-binding protein [Scytonema hofmannii]KYC37139.1 multidrug ABC transporter ATP-binding protein [Scytonema hofmannii PCC 7110]
MKQWWLRLVRYALLRWRGLVFVLLLMLMNVGLNVLKPWPLKLIVDSVLGNQSLPHTIVWFKTFSGAESDIQLLGWLAGSTIVLFLTSEGVRLLQDYVGAGVGSQMSYDLGAALFDRLQHLSLRFHNQNRAGDLVRRVMTDSICIRNLAMGVFLPVVTSLVSLVAMFAVMWQINRLLSLISLLVAPPIVLLIWVFNQPMIERTYQHQQFEGEIMALSEQTLTALPIIQAFGREAHEDERFCYLSRQALQAYLHAILAQMQFKVGVSGVTAVGTAIIMLVGGFQVLDGSLSIGSLLIFLSYLTSLYMPMETLAYMSSGFAAAAASAMRVLQVLDTKDEVQEVTGASPLRSQPGRARGYVCLEGVTFGYEQGRPVLQDVSFEAQPGETIALIGETGVGKSTLVSLIPRFFDPWSGRVLFDGVDIRSVQLKSLRSQISLVLQEPFLLPLTIAENIAYGRSSASREAIVAAAQAANADNFIQRLPQGYDTVIGERGATLSGGEKQRLAIARALLKDAPVLILDEPTSALDAQTEFLLLEALERLMAGRTTFIIAHRLSTVQRADRIVVLEQGRVVESGTHQALLNARGLYYRLHQIQSSRVTIHSESA